MNRVAAAATTTVAAATKAVAATAAVVAVDAAAKGASLVTRQAVTEDALEVLQGNDLDVRFTITLDGAALNDAEWAAAPVELFVKKTPKIEDAAADFKLSSATGGITKRAKVDEGGKTVAVARFTAAQLATAGIRWHRLDVILTSPGRRTFRQGPLVVIDT